MPHEIMVVGFAYFDEEVLLIKKTRPQWQAGKLNGIGGHIKKAESPVRAMCREFREETSVDTPTSQWIRRVHLIGNLWSVDFFRSFLSRGQYDYIRMTTDEEPIWLPVSRLWANPVIPNLRWLVPLCRDGTLDPCQVIAIRHDGSPSEMRARS